MVLSVVVTISATATAVAHIILRVEEALGMVARVVVNAGALTRVEAPLMATYRGHGHMGVVVEQATTVNLVEVEVVGSD